MIPCVVVFNFVMTALVGCSLSDAGQAVKRGCDDDDFDARTHVGYSTQKRVEYCHVDRASSSDRCRIQNKPSGADADHHCIMPNVECVMTRTAQQQQQQQKRSRLRTVRDNGCSCIADII